MMMMGGNNNNYHQVITENEGGGGDEGSNNGGLTLKKGQWTAAEDAVLAEYVRTHGEGNWNAVQKNTGLARCGKSCRLRWANHLRPNLKKGAFSPDEERIIVELHAVMGNKWARMATRLPGRTDNEIKNYWNTRVKRRQRQGLPLYPPEIQSLYSSQHNSQPALTPSTNTSFSFQNPATLKPLQSYNASPSPPHQQLHFYDPHSAPTPPPVQSPSPASTPPPLLSPSTPPPSLPSPSNVSPLQSPHHNPQFSTLPLVDSFTSNTNSNNTFDFYFPRTSPYLQQYPLRHKRFKHDGSYENNNNNNNNGGSSYMLPFSSFNHNTLNPPRQHYSNSFSLDQSTLFQSNFGSGQFISIPGFNYSLKSELPSNQYFTQNEVTLDTKGNSNNYSSNNDDDHHSGNQHSHSSSLNMSGNGFLEDMLQEAQVLTDNNEIMASQSCLVRSSSSSEGLNSGLNVKEETKEEITNTAKHDQDYSNENPSSMTMGVREWYIDNAEGSIGQSSGVTEDHNLGLEFELHDQIASLLSVDHGRSLNSHSWDHNFFGIC